MVDAEDMHLAALQVHRQNELAVRAETRLFHMVDSVWRIRDILVRIRIRTVTLARSRINFRARRED
jgi:hypothetical protein